MNENAKNERETINDWLKEADCLVPQEDVPENVLQEAQRIIYGDREKTYGHPAKNLKVIAEMWNAYIGDQICFCFQPKDVAVMMILLKTARLANDINHRDSIVDICGYAALLERCDE
jgi:Domain of unknown function (DUF6378)